MRLDQWLWAVRLFKSRALAAAAIRGGHAKVNGAATKAAREVRAGEIVTVRIGVCTRTLRVLSAPPSRVGAKLVGQFAEELTPPEEFEKQRTVRAHPLGVRAKGAGRPTKRERREMEEFLE